MFPLLKAEQSLKARKEIADYIALNKPDRARIRVEQIIREDNCVEALEMYLITRSPYNKNFAN